MTKALRLCCLLAISSCGESSMIGGPAGEDAGLATDAGSTADAGRGGDAGPDADVGELDSGPFDGADASADGGSTDGSSDAGPISSCVTPLAWEPDPGARATVEAAVAAWVPDASVDWSDERGTFKGVHGLNIPIACGDTEDVWPILLAMITANPDVFQIDLSEWPTPDPFECRLIMAGGLNRILSTRRAQLGPGEVMRDQVNFIVHRTVAGEIRLRSVSGTYLPIVPPDVADAMSLCGVLDPATARRAVNAHRFDFTTFFMCMPTGMGVYLAQPNDTLNLGAAVWSWGDDMAGGGVLLTKQHSGELILHRSNWTDELLASDANCPMPVGPERVLGFRVIIDADTGAVIGSMPGVGCIVC